MKANIQSFALCGNAGSGKDLAFTIMKLILAIDSKFIKCPLNANTILDKMQDSDWLSNALQLRYDRFAEPIKTCLAGFLDIDKKLLNKAEYKKMTMSNSFYTSDKESITIREAHQILADALKSYFNIDIFALSLIDRIKNSDKPTAILDLRYLNEAAVLKMNDVKVIKIVKDDQGQLMQHSSEQSIKDIEADFVLHNDGKSIKNFTANILRMMQEFGWVSSTLTINDIVTDF